ncbi:MAG: aminopeptidase P family N-terminal domain-containing protein [Saprospiraceae bacterium]|nr:aminopeptidase P family N-terminal domain-containing protein [Saprospiraceae bacterium]
MTIPERIQSLRNWMKSRSLDAIVIPSGDPHKSEYVAEHWKMRIWIAGFTGSAGTVIITQDHVGLWTDSRYFLQAEEELKESGGVLHKLTLQGGSDHVEWLAKELPEGSVAGIDGYLFSSSEIKSMEKILNEKISVSMSTQIHLLKYGKTDLLFRRNPFLKSVRILLVGIVRIE